MVDSKLNNRYTADMGHNEKELLSVVDFILNKADKKDIDVILAAIERKNLELSPQLPIGLSGINPENMARKMSMAINESIASSLGGLKQTVRNFATDIIRQNAPELSEEQLKVLIDSWVPNSEISEDNTKSIAKNGKVLGIPVDILYGMILQFVSYSIGEMSDKENNDLKSSMGNWTEKYWDRFPVQIRQEIKKFIGGEITSGDFKRSIHKLIF